MDGGIQALEGGSYLELDWARFWSTFLTLDFLAIPDIYVTMCSDIVVYRFMLLACRAKKKLNRFYDSITVSVSLQIFFSSIGFLWQKHEQEVAVYFIKMAEVDALNIIKKRASHLIG